MIEAESNTQVIIAGAGPVGLSLALGLARLGVRSVILERRETPMAHSRAPGLLTRTLEVFAQWGVLDRFLSEGRFLQDVGPVPHGAQQPIFRIALGAHLRHQTPYPGALLLPQNRTEALLSEAVENAGLCDIRRGHALETFDETPVGVRVQVHPYEGQPYTLRGAFLVGCDGAHSAVRRCLGLDFPGKTYPSRFLLADFIVDDARDAQPFPRYVSDAASMMATIRMQAGMWRLIGVVPQRETDEQTLAPQAVQARGQRMLGAGSLKCVWADTFHVHCRMSTRFYRGRVALAGDAAHINSPAGGQGMNAGIQDANNLAWKLAYAVSKEGDYKLLLRSYEVERRQVVQREVSRYTDVLTRLLLLPPPVRRLLGRLLKLVLSSEAIVGRLVRRMAMLDTRYETSPLLLGHHPLLGARAPDVALRNAAGQIVHLLDGARCRAVLVLFEGGPNIQPLLTAQQGIKGLPNVTLVRVASQFGPTDADVLRDVDGEAWRRWHAKDGTLALVRPDGHVGWVAQSIPATPSQVRMNVRHALGMRPARVVHPHARGRVRIEAARRLVAVPQELAVDTLEDLHEQPPLRAAIDQGPSSRRT